QHDHAAAVVIIEQADMWDRDGNAVSHLANYEPVIAGIASHATAFGGLVLLFNGDSHIYRSDNPLKQGQPCVTESGSASRIARRSPTPRPGRRTPGTTTRPTTSRTSIASPSTGARSRSSG